MTAFSLKLSHSVVCPYPPHVLSLRQPPTPLCVVSRTSVIGRALMGSRTPQLRHVHGDASQAISAGLCLLCDHFGALIMGNKHTLATFELPINPPSHPHHPPLPQNARLLIAYPWALNTHLAFFFLPSSFPASLTAGRPENTCLCLLCRTRKLSAVTQQPDNHCPV